MAHHLGFGSFSDCDFDVETCSKIKRYVYNKITKVLALNLINLHKN